METAGLLGLPEAKWFASTFLRERDWGVRSYIVCYTPVSLHWMQVLDLMSQEEREARFGELLRSKKQNSLVWKSPGGESMANVCLRVDRMLALWNRECANKKVIAVCHGEVLWAFRIRCVRY